MPASNRAIADCDVFIRLAMALCEMRERLSNSSESLQQRASLARFLHRNPWSDSCRRLCRTSPDSIVEKSVGTSLCRVRVPRTQAVRNLNPVRLA
jgi:hypothetical protein